MAAWFEDDVSGPKVRAQKPVETTLACPVCTPCEVCAGQRSITRTAVPLLPKEYGTVEGARSGMFVRLSMEDAKSRIPLYKRPADMLFVGISVALLLFFALKDFSEAAVSFLKQHGMNGILAMFGIWVLILAGCLFVVRRQIGMINAIRDAEKSRARKRYENLLQQIDPSLTPDNVTFDWYDAPDKVVLYRLDKK